MARQSLGLPDTQPAVKTPAESKAQTIDRFNNNWHMRVDALKGIKGIDLNTHVKPVWRDDMARVKQGKRPYTNAQVLDFITALQNKSAVAKKSSGHGGPFGFVGNALDDVSIIAGSLNPINIVHELYKGGVAFDAAAGRLIGDVGGLAAKKGGGNTGFTNLWNDVQSWIPGYTQGAREVDKTIGNITRAQEKKGNVGPGSLTSLDSVKAAGEGLRTIRGINFIPGSYTAGNLMQGKPGELAQHPVFTALDLLPLTSELSKGMAGLKYGEAAADVPKAVSEGVIKEGSPWEALAQGRAYKAGTRALGLTGETGGPVSRLYDRMSKMPSVRAPEDTGGLITRLSKKAGVSEDIRNITRRWSQAQREGFASKKWANLASGYQAQYTTAENAIKILRQNIEDMTNAPTQDILDAQRQVAEAEGMLGEGVKNSALLGKARKALARAEEDKAAQLEALHQGINTYEKIQQQSFEGMHQLASVDTADKVLSESAVHSQDIIDQLKENGATETEAQNWFKQHYVDFAEWVGKSWKLDENGQRLLTDNMYDATKGTAGKAAANLATKEALEGYAVPKYITRSLDLLKKETKQTLAYNLARGTTSIFKYAVLTGPRHVAHVLFSNGMFIALDDLGALAPSNVIKGFKMATGDPELWPESVPRGTGVFKQTMKEEAKAQTPEDLLKAGVTPEQLYQMSQGKTMMRMLKDWAKATEHSGVGKAAYAATAIFNPFAYRRAEEFLTDMSRATEYIYKADQYLKNDAGLQEAKSAVDQAERNLAPGVTNSMELGRANKAYTEAFNRAMAAGGHEAGVKGVANVLMDIDSMSPLERTVFRNVFPFYPFTRQLFHYMAWFPAEHPFKAAVLASVGRMEMQDAQSGLPSKFMSMFPISGEDAQGNALFIDSKSMNPFRSLNGLSPWTRAGLLSELNPLISIPIAQLQGVNILNATPDLFPDHTIDPNTGDIIYQPKYNFAQQMIEGIVPQASDIEALINSQNILPQLRINNKLRDLQKTDPEAYQRALLSSLNLPFSIGSRNIATERIRMARNQYTVAQQEVSNAIANKDFSVLSGYRYVPYHGKLLTVDQLKKALNG